MEEEEVDVEEGDEDFEPGEFWTRDHEAEDEGYDHHLEAAEEEDWRRLRH